MAGVVKGPDGSPLRQVDQGWNPGYISVSHLWIMLQPEGRISMQGTGTRTPRAVGRDEPARAVSAGLRPRRVQTLRPQRSERSEHERREYKISEHQACLVGLTSVMLAMVSLVLLALMMP